MISCLNKNDEDFYLSSKLHINNLLDSGGFVLLKELRQFYLYILAQYKGVFYLLYLIRIKNQETRFTKLSLPIKRSSL